MNRKDLCTSKYCSPKSQKYVKNKRKQHICFDDKSTNKLLSQNKQCLKYQIIKRRIVKKNKNHHEATRNTLDENEGYFVDALRSFFKLPAKETSEIWKKRNLTMEFTELRMEGLERNSEESLLDNIFDENKINELFIDVTKPLSSSIKFHTKLATRIPTITKEVFGIEKEISKEQMINLIRKEIPSYKKKLVSSNIKQNPYEFIAKWYKRGHEHKYKTLKTFEKVFVNIDELETTKKFCTWLKNHPEIEPPPYLLENGLIERNNSIGTSSSSSIDISRKLSSNIGSIMHCEINYDFILNYFKKYKSSPTIIMNEDTKSMTEQFISDIEIII